MQPLLNLANQITLKSGKILLQNIMNLDRIKIYTNPNTNEYVTSLHHNIFEQAVEVIKKNHRNHDITQSLTDIDSDEYTWIINPIDGVLNYINEVPHFATCVSLMHKNELILNSVYDPINNELFSASKGQGATLNQTRIRIKPKLTSLSICATNQTGNASLLHSRVTDCLSLDLAYVASNRFGASYYVNPNPNIIAHGLLLVKEAGGFNLNQKNHDATMFDKTIKSGGYKTAIKL